MQGYIHCSHIKGNVGDGVLVLNTLNQQENNGVFFVLTLSN